jgi:hypothetical protein
LSLCISFLSISISLWFPLTFNLVVHWWLAWKRFPFATD